MNTDFMTAFSDNLSDGLVSDWEATRAQVKKLLGGTNLKRAVDRACMAGYVQYLLGPWHSQQVLRAFIDEIRAYRRDHRFFECV